MNCVFLLLFSWLNGWLIKSVNIRQNSQIPASQTSVLCIGDWKPLNNPPVWAINWSSPSNPVFLIDWLCRLVIRFLMSMVQTSWILPMMQQWWSLNQVASWPFLFDLRRLVAIYFKQDDHQLLIFHGYFGFTCRFGLWSDLNCDIFATSIFYRSSLEVDQR